MQITQKLLLIFSDKYSFFYITLAFIDKNCHLYQVQIAYFNELGSKQYTETCQ